MSDCRFGVSPVNYPDPDPGCQGGKGDGTDVSIIRDSVDFSLQYEICKMRKFWGQYWSYVISIQKD